MLTGAAKVLLESASVDLQTAMRITKFERRRGSAFLAEYSMWLPPLFGLSHVSNLAMLSDQSMFSVYKTFPKLAVLRIIATSLNLKPTECLIRFRRPGSSQCYEYTTAVPVLSSDASPSHRRLIETKHSSASIYYENFYTQLGKIYQYLAPDTIDELLAEPARSGMRWKTNMPHASKGGSRTQDIFIRLKRKADWLIVEHHWAQNIIEGISIHDIFLIDAESITFNAIAGEINDIALFVKCTQDFRKRQKDITKAYHRTSKSSWIGVEQIIENLNSDSVCPELVLEYFVLLSTKPHIILPDLSRDIRIRIYDVQPYMRSLNALSLATKVYNGLPGATIAADIIKRPLHTAHWLPIGETLFPHSEPLLKRENLFSCIAMLESDKYNLPPDDLKEVMAISARNLLCVSQALLCDPYETSHIHDVTLIIGNVGRSGMILMVAPIAPRLRAMDMEHWEIINHNPFDFQKDDSFPSTTLHLSFTDYELSLKVDDHGSIDHDAAIVETVISVHDKGKWIGDIDVLALYQLDNGLLRRAPRDNCCSHSDRLEHGGRLTSIAKLKELIDIPEDLGQGNIGVIRAYDNWQARQAAACISLQRGFQTVILPPQSLCWSCCCTVEWQWMSPAFPLVSPIEISGTAEELSTCEAETAE